jgi:Rrf2 family protein
LCSSSTDIMCELRLDAAGTDRRTGEIMSAANACRLPGPRLHDAHTQGKIRLKALVDLSCLPAGQLAFVNDIASRNNIPKKFLDAILVELRNAGFVQSRKGKEGGYRLARPADDIRVGHVVRVLDGPLAPFACASRTRYERCEDCDEATCQVRYMMLEVRDAIADVLDNRSLAEMRDAQETGSEVLAHHG